MMDVPCRSSLMTIGDAFVVQHYVAEVRELSAKKIDEQTCEYTNHIHSTAIDQTLTFFEEHDIPFEKACVARQQASHAHNQEETPKFAKSIERRATLGRWSATS
jgi:hypothetical protein